MDSDDKPAGGASSGGEDAGDALSPPERNAKLSRNPVMVAVIVVTLVAVAVFLIVSALD